MGAAAPGFCFGVLQWGRDREVADRDAPPPVPMSVILLQWGRDREVADSRTAQFFDG